MPTNEQLRETLAAAGSAHHDYESNYLNGVRDEQWNGWYAAFTLGRLGDFTSPTNLAKWLGDAQGEGEWASVAAAHVAEKLHGAR